MQSRLLGWRRQAGRKGWKLTSRVLLFVLLLGLGSQVSAQLDRATLAGTVADASGAVIPGAMIAIVSTDTGLRREGQTGANGTYAFTLLPIGSYAVMVTHGGFRTVSMKELRLGVGDNRTLNIDMELSTVETNVTV